MSRQTKVIMCLADGFMPGAGVADVMGHVRAVLWQHLAEHNALAPAAPKGDPNEPLDAAAFGDALDEVRLHAGPAAMREAGASYARLWARTFRTLVRHLRGHPEHALRLWTTEVYPYLRCDRLAARAEKRGPRRFDVLVHDDLPEEYVAGMLAAFVGFSHAEVDVEPRGGGRLALAYRLRPTERVVRLAYQSAQLRIPLLLTSFLAALVGASIAFQSIGPLDWIDVLAVLWGTVAAQSGANAFHDLYAIRPRPLAAPGPSRAWLQFQMIGSYVVAAGALVWLVVPDRPGLLIYGAVGLGLGVAYRNLRDRGWGPAIAAVSHGPLTVWGTFHAFAGAGLLASPVPALLLALPTGLLAGAILYLDDLADRPLDEAAGRRTLVVRLPQRRHAAIFGGLVGGGLIALAAMVGALAWPFLGAVAILMGFGLLLFSSVQRHIDDPHRLAPTRMAAVLLYVAAVTTLVGAILGGA